MPWTLNRNEAGVDLVRYKPSCFSSAKHDNRIILTFCKQTRDHDHLHVKNRKVCNKTRSPQASTLFLELLFVTKFYFIFFFLLAPEEDLFSKRNIGQIGFILLFTSSSPRIKDQFSVLRLCTF